MPVENNCSTNLRKNEFDLEILARKYIEMDEQNPEIIEFTDDYVQIDAEKIKKLENIDISLPSDLLKSYLEENDAEKSVYESVVDFEEFNKSEMETILENDKENLISRIDKKFESDEKTKYSCKTTDYISGLKLNHQKPTEDDIKQFNKYILEMHLPFLKKSKLTEDESPPEFQNKKDLKSDE